MDDQCHLKDVRYTDALYLMSLDLETVRRLTEELLQEVWKTGPVVNTIMRMMNVIVHLNMAGRTTEDGRTFTFVGGTVSVDSCLEQELGAQGSA